MLAHSNNSKNSRGKNENMTFISKLTFKFGNYEK